MSGMVALWIALAGIISLCCMGVVFSRNPISSAVSLLVAFLGIAVLYLSLKAEFVAAVQVLVYAGGIMVLYLFGIMLVDSEVIKVTRQVHWQAWPVFFMVMALFIWMGHKLYRSEYRANPSNGIVVVISGGSDISTAKQQIKDAVEASKEPNTSQVARIMFFDYLYPFEGASVLLLIAVMGAIYLARKEVS